MTRYFVLVGAMTPTEAIDAVNRETRSIALTAGCSVGVYGIAELAGEMAKEREDDIDAADEFLTPTPAPRGQSRCPSCHLIMPCRHETIADVVAVNRNDDSPLTCRSPGHTGRAGGGGRD